MNFLNGFYKESEREMDEKIRFILASKSPRRKQLLSELGKEMGFEFEIIIREVDEDLNSCLPAHVMKKMDKCNLG